MIVALLLVASDASGQKKYEREYRLKKDEVPAAAAAFVASMNFTGKVKWYYEENLIGNSVEAKLKHDKKKYSIEFDTSGNFQDIEVAADFSDIPEAIRNQMKTRLDSMYEKHSVKKVQVQYSGKISSFSDFLSTENLDKVYKMKYEIIVSGKENKEWGLYEITFDTQGIIEHIAQIISRNTDNLEY